MIAAVTKNGIIGEENHLPFDYPADLKHFRASTLNSNIIMGRKTYEGIGRALPKRRNIVISSKKIDNKDIETFSRIEDAVDACAEHTGLESTIYNKDGDQIPLEIPTTWFIGGASIYEAGMDFAQEIHLTITPDINKNPNTVKFPWINPLNFEIYNRTQLVPDDNTLMYCVYYRI